MPSEANRSRPVIRSIEDEHGERCVDFIASLGSYTFKEYRRDLEDRRWSLVADFSQKAFSSLDEAWTGALAVIPWLSTVARPTSGDSA